MHINLFFHGSLQLYLMDVNYHVCDTATTVVVRVSAGYNYRVLKKVQDFFHPANSVKGLKNGSGGGSSSINSSTGWAKKLDHF